MKTVRPKQHISYYHSSRQSSERYKDVNFTLEDIINKCKNNSYDFLTDEARRLRLTDKKLYDDYKTSKLPAVAVVGVLSRRRKNRKYFEYNSMTESDASNGYVFGDIDKLEGYSMKNIKDVLMDDDNIFFIKESLSGQGFHFIFQIDGGVEYYKPALEEKYKQLSSKLGNLINSESFDSAVTDWTRIMVLNNDPNLYYEPSKLVMEVKNKIQEDSEPEKVKASTYIQINKSKLKIINDIDETISKRFNNHIKKMRWDEGKRNKSIGSMKWFMRENVDISIEDISVLFHNWVNGVYTTEYTPVKIDNDLSMMYSDVQEEVNQEKLVINHIENQITENIWRVGDTIYFDKYINEKQETLELLKNKLDDNKILLIDAPTGGGKTWTMYDFINKYNIKTDFILPTRLLTEQQKHKSKFVIGSNKEVYEEDLVVCSTWENLPKLKKRKSDLLIIDEAHLMITSFNFKASAISRIIEYSNNYKNIILLSGTPEPFDGFFNNSQLIFRKNNPSDITYNIIPFGKKKIEFLSQQIMNFNKKDSMNIYYKNNLDEITQIKEVIEKQTNKKVGILSSEEKDGVLYHNIKDNQILGEDIDWLLTTCVIREGVNITDDIDNVNIVFGTGVDITEIKQFTARFRNAKNIHITIFHKNINCCHYIDKTKIKNTILNWKEEFEYFKNENNNFMFSEYKKFFRTMSNMIYDDDGVIKINTIQILAYIWLYSKFNQINNIKSLEYYMKKYFREDNSVKFDPIDLNLKEVKKINECYNQSKRIKKELYINELLEQGELKEKFNYQTKINENYFKLIKYFRKEDIKDLPIDLSSKNNIDKFLNNLKFIVNYNIYNKKYDYEKNIKEFFEIKYLKFIEEIMKKTHTREEVTMLLEKHNLLEGSQFRINNPVGLNMKKSTTIINNNQVKTYSFTLMTLEDLKLPKKLRDYDKLKYVINGGMTQAEVIKAWEDSKKVNEWLEF